MGQAREVMDRLTEALAPTPDLKAIAALFAQDAVAVTPDAGEITGRDNIVEYWRQMTDAVSETTYERVAAYESGNTAIDEGIFGGRNTGPLQLSSGELLPPTGNVIRIRGCDFATVQDGLIVNYRVYFNQLDFLEQLGLLPVLPS
ncbi:nuclear transport factor 2 family protein [Streptomyces sp. NPDC006208]|uniref:ester cyclase n=1 Tax=unclassified Streptomyces TaxID=2593676 RepID=UPI002E1A25F8